MTDVTIEGWRCYVAQGARCAVQPDEHKQAHLMPDGALVATGMVPAPVVRWLMEPRGSVLVSPVRTPEQHEAAMGEVSRLMDVAGWKHDGPENDRLHVLASLVDAYEREHHSTRPKAGDIEPLLAEMERLRESAIEGDGLAAHDAMRMLPALRAAIVDAMDPEAAHERTEAIKGLRLAFAAYLAGHDIADVLALDSAFQALPCPQCRQTGWNHKLDCSQGDLERVASHPRPRLGASVGVDDSPPNYGPGWRPIDPGATAVTVEPGDVVQMGPENERFAYCFAIVEEVRDCGVLGMVRGPAAPAPHDFPIRIKNGQFVRIGKAEWAPRVGGDSHE